MKRLVPAYAILASLFVSGGTAFAFERVENRSDFIETVREKELVITRPFFLRSAIKLEVSPDGEIIGRAMSQPVKGGWRWENGLFCRDLFWGERDLGPNCQVVEVLGDRIRFTADYGRGKSAEFQID
jgi:hypothetical protein